MGSASGGAGLGAGVGLGLGILATIATAGAAAPTIPALVAGGGIGAAVGGTTGYGMENSAQQATNTKNAASDAQKIQTAQAAQLQNTLLTQPKNVTPDNFLATKSAQLANLRLGLASTITGAGGAPSPVLGAPSLTGNYPGKAKLGA